jgi:co-chaperonin GroES (HSP10)
MNIKIEQIELLGTRILIKPDPVKQTHEIVTAGGLVSATGKQITNNNGIQSMEDVEPPVGTIVAVGAECKILKVGDKVLFSPFSGKKLDFMLETYLLMSEPEPVMKINIAK